MTFSRYILAGSMLASLIATPALAVEMKTVETKKAAGDYAMKDTSMSTCQKSWDIRRGQKSGLG